MKAIRHADILQTYEYTARGPSRGGGRRDIRVGPNRMGGGGNSVENRQQLANRVGPLLGAGDAICCRVGEHNGRSKPTGIASILIYMFT